MYTCMVVHPVINPYEVSLSNTVDTIYPFTDMEDLVTFPGFLRQMKT